MSSTPIAVALEKQYLLSLIELEIRRRFELIKRRINKAQPKKTCPICGIVLQNQQRTFCSKKCVCRYMSAQLARPESYQQRAEQRQKRLVTIHCKTCHKDMGRRKPGSVTYCGRRCVGRDPDISRSKSEKRFLKWQDPAYRQAMSERARVQVADPTSRFGKPRPSS